MEDKDRNQYPGFTSGSGSGPPPLPKRYRPSPQFMNLVAARMRARRLTNSGDPAWAQMSHPGASEALVMQAGAYLRGWDTATTMAGQMLVTELTQLLKYEAGEEP